VILGVGAPSIDKGIENFIAANSNSYKSLVLTHAERFIELASMIFDL
jgi:hypothetical protein